LKALAEVQSARKDIVLGPRPGQRIRSGVVAPPSAQKDKPPVVVHGLGDDLEESSPRKPLMNEMIDLDE
jgi:hypothetical protein